MTLKKKPVTAPYTIHGETLDVVNSAKLLGVTIDSKLNFNEHVSAVSKKAHGTRNIRTKRLMAPQYQDRKL